METLSLTEIFLYVLDKLAQLLEPLEPFVLEGFLIALWVIVLAIQVRAFISKYSMPVNSTILNPILRFIYPVANLTLGIIAIIQPGIQVKFIIAIAFIFFLNNLLTTHGY